MVPKTILLSPVGTTDPFRENHDGPLLHILRHYPVDVVYLFMTKEISSLEAQDRRYTQSIQLLKPNCLVVRWDTGVEDPSDFDAFKRPYTECLENIFSEFEKPTVLVNISSGTPQMIGALCIEIASGTHNLHPIQVKTFRKSANRERQMDTFGGLEARIAALEDAKPTAENRTVEPAIVNFKHAFLKSQLKTLIENYQYHAALEVFNSGAEFFRDAPDIKCILTHLCHRVYLKNNEAKKALEGLDLDFHFFPYQGDSETVFEYFSVMRIDQIRGNISSLVLRLNPLVTHVAEEYARRYIDLDSLIKDFNGISKFTREKIESYNPALLQYLDQKFSGQFRDTFINMATLRYILDFEMGQKFSEQKRQEIRFDRFSKVLGQLVGINEKIRNTEAHSITVATEETLKCKTEQNSQKLITTLIKFLDYAYQKDLNTEPFIYDEINQRLIVLLDSESGS